MDLSEHETASQHRYEDLKRHATESHQHHKEKEMHVPEVNYFAGSGMGGAGAGLGAGLGGGLLGGILGGALLGNRGLIGGGVGVAGEVCATPMQLQTSTASIVDTIQNSNLQQSVGDIKQGIFQAEGNLQLAIAQAQAQTATQIGQTENAILLGQTSINKGVTDAIAASLASQNQINLNVSAQGSATREAVAAQGQINLMATKDASSANLAAIAASTNQILSALKDNEITNLSRQLTVSELRNSEDRAEARSRQVEVNVAQTVTQNQNNLQAQAQSQSQFQLLAQLAAGFNNLTNDVQAIRQGSVVFNSGTMAASGNQSAQNTRVA